MFLVENIKLAKVYELSITIISMIINAMLSHVAFFVHMEMIIIVKEVV